MTGNHVSAVVLARYAAGDQDLPAMSVDAVEHHLLECEACRLVVAEGTDRQLLDRSWAGVAVEVRVSRNDSRWSGGSSRRTVGTPLDHENRPPLELARREASRPRRTRSRISVAAAVVLVVLVAVGVVATRLDQDPSVTSTQTQGWTDILPTDAEALRGAQRPVAISAVVEWGSRLLVVTANEGSGATAWVSSDGHWERREFVPPAGCDPHGGLVAIGELLTISCASGEEGAVFVASSRDLETWSVHPVASAGPSFGTSIGPGIDGGLTVVLLEAADPNTTFGATVRAWEGDLDTWREVPAEGSGFVDAAPQRIRSFGDHVVIAGGVNEYPTGPGEAVVVRPALWVSEGGGPFRRTLLPPAPADPPGGAWSFEAIQTLEGYAVVGGTADGKEPRSWTSSDLMTWTPSSIPMTAAASGQSMWSVAMTPDGTLLASGLGNDPQAPATYSSTDDGRTWRLVSDGPELLSVWNDQVVGARSGAPLRVLQWNAPAEGQTPEAIARALVVDVGAVDAMPAETRAIMAVPSEDGRHEALFVLRDDEDRLVALSARSPMQGCRLVDVDAGDLDLEVRPEVQFHDPCHGSSFDRDGTLVEGPAPRGMYRYDVTERGDRILVDLALAHPGAARTGADLGELDVPPAGTTDAVAARWVTAARVAAAEVRGEDVRPFVWVLGGFHDEDTGLVTVPFTVDGRVGTIFVGPATMLPPHEDSAPRSELAAFRLERGTLYVDDGGPGSESVTARMDLSNRTELRVRFEWHREAADPPPIDDIVALIEEITRRQP